MIALDAGFVGMHASLLSPTNTAAVAATAKATAGSDVGLVLRRAAEIAGAGEAAMARCGEHADICVTDRYLLGLPSQVQRAEQRVCMIVMPADAMIDRVFAAPGRAPLQKAQLAQQRRIVRDRD